MDFIKDLSIDKIRNAAEDAFNQAKPKTEVEARVYEVLSHKNWGSSSTLMNEIARDTYDYDKFPVVTKIMWEAMENQRPAAWRVVFKGLTLLEHLVKNGSERCVDDARNHSHTLRSLHQFNYYEGTVDRGVGVREKSKQLVEILGDDDRIREERNKARKLREKFGGNLGAVSGGGSGIGGGGGGYAGYGNDSGGWESGGGGGGYGDSGIGSSAYRSGGGGGGYGGDSGGGYSGRYSDGADTTSPGGAGDAGASSTPTFATIPEEKPKKTKKKTKKKKKKEEALPAPAPEPAVDLFSFDAPAPVPATPATTTNADAFDSFQSAPAVAAPAPAQFDAFGEFGSAPSQPAQQQQQQPFDAFGGSNVMGTTGANIGAMNNAFGSMTMQQQQQPAMNGAGGGGGDDDFGDFEDASAPAKATTQSPDPLSRLISLDSLQKNQKKPDKLHEPVIATPAAAQFVHQQNQQTQQQLGAQATANAAMSFQGIDGLNKPIDLTPRSPNVSRTTTQPVMPTNVPVLGNPTAGGADAISMMGPPQQTMPRSGTQQQPQQASGMMASGQMGMMTPQQQQLMMQQQMMMMQQQQQQMGGQMMNAGTQGMSNAQGGGMYMGNMQGGGGMMPGGGGGVMNPNVQASGGMYNMQGGNVMGGSQMGGGQGGGGNAAWQ